VKIPSKIPFWFLTMIIISRPAIGAEPAKAHPPAKLEPIKSVFIIPANTKEGRDPFFPESTRVYEVSAAVAAVTAHVAEITTLKIKGYSLVNGQPMVIINNHAFMINDEGDVLTSSGRVHVRCIDIKSSFAIIAANGQIQKLRF
jgi:hypothetical protein